LCCTFLTNGQKSSAQATQPGIFDGQDDMGKFKRAGSGTFGDKNRQYEAKSAFEF